MKRHNLKQIFIIDSFIKDKENILVDCTPLGNQPNKIVPVTIPIKKFETFLLVESKLDWELNWSEAGEHEQRTGQMDMQEYWDGKLSYIYDDLYEYIVTYPILFRGKIEEDAATSIVNQLNKY